MTQTLAGGMIGQFKVIAQPGSASQPSPPSPMNVVDMASLPLPLHVAIIDDQLSDILIIHQGLLELHIPVRISSAWDGIAGERLLRSLITSCDCPDLILLDLKMPHATGGDLLHQLRRDRLCTSTPIIIMSSSASSEDRLHSESLAAAEFVLKPRSYDELLPLLSRLIATHCPFQLARRDAL
jgi:CheY-like chemotaxis protein